MRPRYVRTNIRQCSWNLIGINILLVAICSGFLVLVARSKSPVPKSFGEWMVLALFVAMVVLGLANVGRGVARLCNHQRHPFWKKLQLWGTPETVEQEIDDDVHAKSHRWLFDRGLFRPFACRYEDLIWVYLVQTKHSINFFPVGKSYGIGLHDKYGQSFEVARTSNDDQVELHRYIAHAPWAVIGFSPEMEHRWYRDRRGLVEEVEARRRSFERCGRP